MVQRPGIKNTRCIAIFPVDVQVVFDPSNDYRLFSVHRTTYEQVRDHRGIWSSFITIIGVMESAKIPSPVARIALVLSTLGLQKLIFFNNLVTLMRLAEMVDLQAIMYGML